TRPISSASAPTFGPRSRGGSVPGGGSGSLGCRSAPPTPAITRARSTTTGPSSRCLGADTPARGCYGCLVPPTVLTPAIRDEVARLGKADIMVGIPSFKNAATIGYVVRAAQAGLVQYFPDLHPVVVNSDAGSPDGTGRVVIETEPPDYIERILLTRPTNKLER